MSGGKWLAAAIVVAVLVGTAHAETAYLECKGTLEENGHQRDVTLYGELNIAARKITISDVEYSIRHVSDNWINFSHPFASLSVGGYLDMVSGEMMMAWMPTMDVARLTCAPTRGRF
jgi:hypothetical protein